MSLFSVGYNAFEGSNNMRIKWTTIDPVLVSKIWHNHLAGDPLSKQARRLILQKIGTDITFKRGDDVLELNAEFKKIVDKYWSQFVVDCYDVLQVIGVIPVEFVRANGDENSDLVPIIPKPNTYIIQLSYIADIGRTIYRVIRPKTLFFRQE